ncbi:vacuole membrane protein 1 [Clonorchis sinensis]|nr:vacuole membrane protein 1 [Clonorchis sinensis]
MARGARLSDRHNDEDLKELEEILATEQTHDSVHTKDLSFQKRAELLLHRLIIRAGFVGILLCASVPNPLFDLAGMTCGHFLVPFWSFFGATVIGKAIIKVHLQQFTVIALSSEHHVESLVHLMGRIPVYGRSLQAPFLEYLQQQKANLHNKVTTTHQSWLQTIILLIVTGLICSFVVSIIHALANKYQRRLRQWQRLAEDENLNAK